MSGGMPIRAAMAMVLLSALLQLASITTPGWLVDINGDTEIYRSVFYRTICHRHIKEECLTEAIRDTMYMKSTDAVLNVDIGMLSDIAIDHEYHKVVQKQVFVIVIFALVVFVLLLLLAANQFHLHGAVPASAVLLATAGGLMIGLLCNDFVDLAYFIEIRGWDKTREHTYIGFPYSIAMYTGSLLLLVVPMVVFIRQNNGGIGEKAETHEYTEMTSALRKAENTSALRNDEKKTDGSEVGKDNPVFSVLVSEKL